MDRRQFLRGAAAGALGLALTGGSSRRAGAEEGKKDEPAGGMKTRPFGKTGADVSVVAFGCGAIRANPQHVALLRKAHESGINFFDTAQNYGNGQSESALGDFVKGVEDREKVYLLTKASHFRRDPKWTAKEVGEALRKNVDGSRARLQSDYIDFFLCPHGMTDLARAKDKAVRDALRELREKKVIRHIGASSHSNYGVCGLDAVEEGFFEVLMVVTNLATQNVDALPAPEDEGGGGRRRGRAPQDTRPMLRAAAKRKVGILAMKAAKNGYVAPELAGILAKEFPEETGLSAHQKLYAYMLRQTGVSAVAVGIQQVAHLKEAIAIGRMA